MLRWRLLLGTVFISSIVGLCWADYHAATPGIWFAPLAILLSVAASQEMLWMLAARDLHPRPCLVIGGNLAIVVATLVPALRGMPTVSAWSLLAFAIAVLIVFADEILHYKQPGGVVQKIAITIFALFYVGLLLSMVAQLRFVLGPKLGLVSLVSLVAVVKLSDIGAYTFGRLFGRRKLTPVLSPGKTVEGAIGGLVFACLGSFLTLRLMFAALSADQSVMPWWTVFVFGIFVGIGGMLGDLAESLIKRDMGKKDSSSWMPGFGGVLDLIDSILFAAPVAIALWHLFLSFAMIGPRT